MEQNKEPHKNEMNQTLRTTPSSFVLWTPLPLDCIWKDPFLFHSDPSATRTISTSLLLALLPIIHAVPWFILFLFMVTLFHHVRA